MAAETRKILGLVQYDRVDIFRALKDISFPKQNKGNISGFMRNKDAGLIVINASRSLGHQYFTAAHEFYHIKYDIGISGRVCPINKFEEEYPKRTLCQPFCSSSAGPNDALEYMILKGQGKQIT